MDTVRYKYFVVFTQEIDTLGWGGTGVWGGAFLKIVVFSLKKRKTRSKPEV